MTFLQKYVFIGTFQLRTRGRISNNIVVKKKARMQAVHPHKDLI